MTTTIHDFGHTIIVMDARRIVAKAMRVCGVWRLRRYGDDGWGALHSGSVGITGKIDPRLCTVRTKRHALRILRGVALSGR